uniref:Uncharacterized protein n=1 Tax=viral metagenome TaxID=1070528 RepID=A0A6M3IF64_9ZZZZ
MTTKLEKKLGKKPTGLPQSLQTEQRGVKLFYDNEFVGYEDVYTPTPEQLDIELEAEARELAIKDIAAKKKEELKENKKDK